MRISQTTGKEMGSAEKKRLALAEGEAVRIVKHFTAIPPPPIDDPIATMGWCNNILSVCVDLLVREPSLSPAEIARIRLAMDGCAKAGMIRDKSAESRAMQAALRSKGERQLAAGLEANPNRSAPPIVARPPG